MSSSEKVFYNKKILIYGMGKTGFSSYNYLKKNNHISIYDDKQKALSSRKLKIKNIYQDNFDFILVSPGINIKKCGLKNYLKKNLNKIVTDLDVFYSENSKNNIITITGTNGKSTTAKLLHEILLDHKKDSRLCGNIGNPILSQKKISKKTMFVIEASSYQIAYSSIFKTNYAAILNLSPDHLERHGSMKKYVDAKFKLIKNQKKKDFAFLNSRDKYLKFRIKKNKILSKIINVEPTSFKNIKKKITNRYFFSSGNQENLSFIFSIGKKLNLKNKKILKIINKFKGLKYRQEIVYKSNKISIINDSKATSFASTINILKSSKKVFWIVGGIGKLGDKFNLKKEDCKNIRAYIFGKNKNFFVKKLNNKLSYKCFSDLESVVKKIKQELSKSTDDFHKTILFSPAAASFDSFKNFEKRGEYFNFLIKKYKIKKISNVQS